MSDEHLQLTADQLLRLECARIAPDESYARRLYAFIKEDANPGPYMEGLKRWLGGETKPAAKAAKKKGRS